MIIELKFLYCLAIGVFSVIGLICIVTGANRGNHIKRANSHTISWFVCFMTFWYILSITIPFGLVIDRDDGEIFIPFLRFVAGFSIITSFTILMTYAIKKNSLNLLLHFIVCISIFVFLFLGVYSFDASTRRIWTFASIAFSILLFIHTIRESRREHITNIRFISTIIVVCILYSIILYTALIYGPLNEKLIEYYVQETIITITDLIVSSFCSILVAHYSWAITIKTPKLLSPGDISNMKRKYYNTPSSLFVQQDQILLPSLSSPTNEFYEFILHQHMYS